MIIFNEIVENNIKNLGFNIIDIGLGGRNGSYFKDCNWWKLTYRLLNLSIYYDPSNVLGSVGQPYYELWDGDNTERAITEEHFEAIYEALQNARDKHDIDILKNPENFI